MVDSFRFEIPTRFEVSWVFSEFEVSGDATVYGLCRFRFEAAAKLEVSGSFFV